MTIINTVQYAFDGSRTLLDTTCYSFLSYSTEDGYADYTEESKTGYGAGDYIIFNNVVGSEWYIGSDVSFQSLYMALNTIGVKGTGNIVWEYASGPSTWSTLTMAGSGTADLTSPTYEAALDWDTPSDWVDSTVNEISARWIRCRMTSTYTTPPAIIFASIGRTTYWSKTIDIPYTSINWQSTYLDWSLYLNNNYGAIRFVAVYARLGGTGSWVRLTSPSTGYTGTNNQMSIKNIIDLYPLFKLNWIAGDTQLLEIRFAITAISSNNGSDYVTELAGRLNLTYQYDATENNDTIIKTIRIPLKSLPNGISNIDQLVDTIPALNTFLPESSKIIKDWWIEVEGNNCNNESDNSVYGLQAHIDNLSSEYLINCVNTSFSSSYHWSVYSLNSLDLDTSNSHSFYLMATEPNNLFNTVNSVVYVTYTYSKSLSTTVLQSLIIPLGYASTPLRTSDAINSDGQQFNLTRPIWIAEPGNITIQKSGIRITCEELTYASNAQVYAIQTVGDSAFTEYQIGTRGNPAGQISIMHPLDNLSLIHGKNYIGLTMYSLYNDFVSRGRSHVLYLNYTSNVDPKGEWRHNKTIMSLLMNMSYVEGTWANYANFCSIGTSEQSNYLINDASLMIYETGQVSQPFNLYATIYNDTSQHTALQWSMEHSGPIKFLTTEHTSQFYVPVLEWFSQISDGIKPISNVSGKMKPYIGNGYGIIATQNSLKSLIGMTTFHSISTDISGRMYRMPGTPNEVILISSDVQDLGCITKQATINSDGTYSISWPDDSADIAILAHYSGSAYAITQRNKSSIPKYIPPAQPLPFKMLIDTTKDGSATNHFILPLDGVSTYNFDIDWGDSNIQTITSNTSIDHTYSAPGVYTISITENVVGGFPTIYFNNMGDCLKLMQISQWGTNKWVSLIRSFNGCSNMNIVATDVATANTSSITSLSYAWRNCSGLTSFPLINTSNVTDFEGAWWNCSGLTSFPLINTSNGTGFSGAWYGCSGLTSFPLINTANGINFSYTWGNCTNLTSVPLLNMRKITNGSQCFLNDTLDTTSYSDLLIDMALGVTTSVTFDGGNSKYNTAGSTARSTLEGRDWTIIDGGVAPVVSSPMILIVDTTKTGSANNIFILPCNGSGYDAQIDWGDGDVETITGSPGNVTHEYSSSGIYNVSILENVVGGFPTIYFNNSGDCLKLMQLSQWGTNKWISFVHSFHGCGNLTITATDSATANTGSVENFSFAWRSCSSMISFPLIDTSSGTDFSYTWAQCSGLTSFPLLDTSNVINFSGSWFLCSGLTSFPLINTSNGTTFTSSWSNCGNLLEFPLLDTAKGTAFNAAWQNCYSLTSFPVLDVGEGINFASTWGGIGAATFPLLDTSKGTDFSSAWVSSNLTEFPLLDTSKGTDFSSAWNACTSLTSFPLLDTSNGTNFDSTWASCSNLTSFPTLNLRKITTGSSCFNNTPIGTESYSNLLIDMALGATTGVNFGAGSNKYSAAGATARATLVGRSWNISDGGSAASMIITVDTTQLGSSASDAFTLPCYGSDYNATINWGDESSQTITGSPGDVTHVYSDYGEGTYNITITENVVGGFPTIYFNNSGDCLKLMQISQWGTNKWLDMKNAFYGCRNMTITATDGATANTGAVTNFSSAWLYCSGLTSFPLIDTSSGINFSGTWGGCSNLTSFPLINTANGTDFSYTWNSCYNLESFSLINTTNGTNFTGTWAYCVKLTSFPTINLQNIIYGNGCFTSDTLDTDSYSNLLINMALGATTGVTFDGGNSKYNTAGATARSTLDGRSWIITDGGAAP